MTPSTAPLPAGRSLRGVRAAAGQWWPAAAVLTLVVASEYKWRLRPNDQAVAGEPDPFVLLEIGLYALVAVLLFLRFRPGSRLRRAELPVTYLAYAYAVVLAGSALYAPYPELALVRGAQVLVLLALSRSIARHADDAALHRVAHAYAVLMAGSVVFGVLVPFPRLPTQPDRFTWLYVHPVQAGSMLAVAVVLLTAYALTGGLARTGPRWPPPAYWALLAVCAGGLVATKTRGAVAGAVVGVLVVLWTRWRGRRRVEAALVSTTVLVVAVLGAGRWIEAYFARGESAERLATLNSRTDLWEYAIELFARQPLYGYGLTASRGLFLERIGLGGGHNALVNLLVDTGTVGALVWLALLAALLVTALRLARTRPALRVERMVVLSVLLAMLANSVFTEGMGAPATALCTWLFVLLAWVAVAHRTGSP
ncbi:O-antigen ligase [Amycolatopsis arida]|uniref:O-antigen ligase n=1 Tax=Amycolatopsis arida TaxID=587909 RepID=A0A1I5Z6X3_9PSEU|nr:O-antigen ligase family protein [Amycolatopsis arida]TDX90189.1 O-antigen ligase [Amycolatopsis arida]SFQ52213.1 O-antigen ligase [Amycolatopsis arida]